MSVTFAHFLPHPQNLLPNFSTTQLGSKKFRPHPKKSSNFFIDAFFLDRAGEEKKSFPFFFSKKKTRCKKTQSEPKICHSPKFATWKRAAVFFYFMVKRVCQDCEALRDDVFPCGEDKTPRCNSCNELYRVDSGQRRHDFTRKKTVVCVTRNSALLESRGYRLDPVFFNVSASDETCDAFRLHALWLIDSSNGDIRVHTFFDSNLIFHLYVRRRYLVQVRAAVSCFFGAYFSRQLPCPRFFGRDLVRIIGRLIHDSVDDALVWGATAPLPAPFKKPAKKRRRRHQFY